MEDLEFDYLMGDGSGEKAVSIRDKYRSVFSSEMGREVLADILITCHFGSTLNPDNRANVAEYNVGVVILARMGIFRDNVREVVNSLCSIPSK